MSGPGTGDAPAVLVAEGMTVRYQGTPEPAVRDVSLRVPAGGGLVVTGPEGCGKTTVVRALMGLVAPLNGTLTVLGADPRDPAVRRRMGYCPERQAFPGAMRVREALDLVAALRGAGGQAGDAAARAAGLPVRDARRVGRLEIEDVRRLSLACALVGEPEALVLDDPWEFPETVEALRAARDRGAAVLVATPDPGGYPELLGAVLELDEEGVPVGATAPDVEEAE